MLGITHANVGGWLLQKWQLPSQLVDPIMFHHKFHPSRANAERTAVVHLADILVRSEGYGSGGDRRIPVASEEAVSLLLFENATSRKSWMRWWKQCGG